MALLSEDLIAQARSVTLLEYLQKNEPGSVKKGVAGRYVHKDHDSFVIDNGKGQFFWNSRGVGGHSAADYLVKVEGMDFRSAVLALTGGERIFLLPDQRQTAQNQPFQHLRQPISPQTA